MFGHLKKTAKGMGLVIKTYEKFCKCNTNFHWDYPLSSSTFSGNFPVGRTEKPFPFSPEPEFSEFLTKWKAPLFSTKFASLSCVYSSGIFSLGCVPTTIALTELQESTGGNPSGLQKGMDNTRGEVRGKFFYWPLFCKQLNFRVFEKQACK